MFTLDHVATGEVVLRLVSRNFESGSSATLI
jgi:hypothetical protein